MAFEGPSGFDVVCETWAEAWEPRHPLSIPEWAARFRLLSGKAAAEPGPWRNERIPYLAGVMAALDDSHPAPLIVFKKSSQVGGSECGLNWVGRTIHQAPTSILALFPGEKDARKWVRVRLNTMLAETPELRRLIPPGRRSEAGNTLQEKHYPGGVLYTGSANIPQDVASVSVAKLLLDEVDRMPVNLENEGDPIELAKRRTATFPRRKVFEISTPTTEEFSRIDADYRISTQDRFYVPCAHCGTFQALAFENLKWGEGKPEQAAYMCEECAALIEERHKTEMLEAGEWRATHPEREELVKGFHINGLYTPIGLGDTWAQHAAAWDQARTSPAKIQVFYNTRRGEVVKSERVKLEWEALAKRREPYQLRTIPREALLLTAGADVQHDRIEVLILGWCRNERAVVIDHAVHYGDPTREEVWGKLDEYLEAEILNASGVRMRIAAAAVDSGNWQHEVTNFTRTRRARNVFATKGSSIATRQPIGKPTYVDVNFRGKQYKRGAEQYQIGVSVLKSTLYARLKADAETLPADRHLRFAEELPDEFFRQLAAETHDARNGWVKIYDRNEVLDLTVLAMAAAMHHAVQIHRLRELDWQRLEQLYTPTVSRAPRDEPKLGAEPVPRRSGGFLPTVAITTKGPE